MDQILPITAICYLNHHPIIICASGPNLAVLIHCKLENIVQLLSKSVTIHAIFMSERNSQTLLTVCGQKELRIVRFIKPDRVELFSPNPVQLNDWIMTCHIIDKYLCAVTIHNVLLILELETGNMIKRCEPLVAHIIYSACLHGEDIDSLKIASGSLLNKILVWSPKCLKPVELIGHQGVIFSVRFNQTGTKLVSVSDDRTVRVWNVDGNDSLRATFYGHVSRVWDAQFIPGTSDSKILSIGEDCTLRLWDLSSAQCIHTFLGHRGRNVWCLAIDSNGEFAFTGGNDCSVRKWNLTPFVKESKENTSPVSAISFDKESPRLVLNILASKFIVLTNCGRIWLLDVSIHSQALVFQSELISLYGVMALSPKRDIVSLGGLKGDVILLRVSDWKVIYLDKLTNGKVLSLNWSSQFLVVCGQDVECILCRVLDDKVEKLNRFSLPSTSNRFVNSFITIEMENCFSIVCGDAKGCIHFYRLLVADTISMPNHSLFKIHGADTVTSLQSIGNLLYSTGRDGKLVLISVENGKLVFKNSFQIYKNYGWLERIYIHPEGPILAVMFHANEILLVNVREDTILLALPCGGGHRSWDINSFEEIMTGRFFLSYIKCSEVLSAIETIDPITNRPFSVPFLGRECVSICFINEDENNIVLACGSESGELSIVKSHENTGLEIVTTNQCHVGNILCLKVLCHSNGDKFMFSAGGRGSLKVWEINLGKAESVFETYFYLSEVSAKPIYKRRSKKGDSEIDDFRITTISILTNDNILDNRIPLVFCGCSDGYIRVYLFEKRIGFRLVTFVEHSNRCVLSSCLYLQNNLTPFLLSAATDGVIIIWNLSPLLLYLEQNKNISQDIFQVNLLEKASSFSAHQSGVNSIFSIHNPPLNTLRVASGGDDNCVTITTLECVKNIHKVTHQLSDSSQHTSSIMSTRILYLEGVIFLVTVGRDQILKVLRLKEGEREFILLAKKELSVTNISGMECKLFKERLFLFVNGEGIQFISLNLVSSS